MAARVGGRAPAKSGLAGSCGGRYPELVDTEQIARALDGLRPSLPLAKRVRRWDARHGVDSTGDRAVWVHPVFDDADADATLGADRDAWNELRAAIKSLVADVAGVDVVTYVRLRLVSEAQSTTPA